MKRNFISLCTVFLFISMLIFPKAVFTGASDGLLLWFRIILPTLFPFLLLSSFLLATGNIHYITNTFGWICSRLFHVSSSGSFCILVGFLCGYPMGAKAVADMIEAHLLSKEEGTYLLSFCNNTSPAFIMNYLVLNILNKQQLLVPTILILFLTPFIISLFTRRKFKYIRHTASSINIKPPSKHCGTMQTFDFCLMNSFETLIKIGGYIILFSIILSLCRLLPFQHWLFYFVLSSFEITNGLSILAQTTLPFQTLYSLMVGLTAFGGFCSIAQTQCVLQKVQFSLFLYTIQKLAAAMTASLLSILYLKLL